MQINRSIANDTAARQRNAGLLTTTQQWSQDANGRAHFPDNVVWRNTVNLFGGHGYGATRAFHLCTEVRQNLEHVIRVAQVRHTMNDTWLPSQQCRGENR